MLLIKSLESGRTLDITPGQEITLTLENPLFADDRMPVAVSTGIEFPLSPTNKAEFRFVNVMMIPPAVQKIPAAIIFEGFELFSGELQFDEFSDQTLKYTFVGADATEAFSGNIHEIACRDYSGMAMSTFVQNARKGDYPDIGLPMIVRKANSAKIEYPTAAGEAECSSIDKYANYLYTNTPYIIPAIKAAYLLEKIHPRLIFPSQVQDYLDRMAILGTYKPEAWQNDRYGIPYTTPSWNNPYIGDGFNAAEALPEMTKTEFVINILKMFCATIFPEKGRYSVRTNSSILQDKTFIDWTQKVSDVYAIVAGETGSYSLEYANGEQSYDPAKEEDFGEELAQSIYSASNYEELISKFRTSDNYVDVRVTFSGNVYSGKAVKAYLYWSRPSGVTGGVIFNKTETSIPLIDIVFQANVNKVELSEGGGDGQNYENNIGFICTPCIPANVATLIYTGSTNAQVTLRAMAPVVDIPTVGGNRPSDVYIGLLIENNFFDQGNYFTRPEPYIDGGSEMANTRYSIAIGGTNGLYAKFHETFAQWQVKKKDSVKADVVLSPADIAQLKLWRKIMLYNRLFLIKTMEITLSDRATVAFANAEFVEV
ncbi:hypothetical protein [Alistipes senegalensis]|uniref:Uncharacterized protein n=1 Tax=Alistipes senegalensis JC50 TaxID=1033732 RepID=A0ABY5VAG4_9BACT|nr:hypothetical protein [Alistipes senegalensis]UEA86219.1 hypothetical protein LK406_10950 [Alistipes senegalensis]UWN66194.1 hypothetical protein NQ519_04995 [Alistipes senegalensis JC50]